MLNYLAFAVDQELLEVPLHVSSFELRILPEPFVDWMLPLVENGDLLHHGELNVVLLYEVQNPLGVVRFLRTKLIAGEGEDFKALVLKFLVHFDQLSVVALGHTSLRCDVDDEDGLLTLGQLAHSLLARSVEHTALEVEEGLIVAAVTCHHADSGTSVGLERGTVHALGGDVDLLVGLEDLGGLGRSTDFEGSVHSGLG